MTTAFNRTGVIAVPAIILDAANDLANCFESSFPSAPVFRLGYEKSSPPGTQYALVQPALRNSSITAMINVIQSELVGRPAWDNVQDEEGNYKVNLGQAMGLLNSAVQYEHDPEATSISLPNSRLWIGFDMAVQQVIALAGLVPISP